MSTSEPAGPESGRGGSSGDARAEAAGLPAALHVRDSRDADGPRPAFSAAGRTRSVAFAARAAFTARAGFAAVAAVAGFGAVAGLAAARAHAGA